MNTPEVVLYIATSLDGYIATPDGGIDWLASVEKEGLDYGYKAFYDSVDALIMGRVTYEQVLGFGEWPYPGKACWVFGQQISNGVGNPKDVCVVSDHPETFLAELAASGVKKAWLVGGGNLVSSFANRQLISEYIISIVPVLLGRGIPLFSGPGVMQNLRLEAAKRYDSGLVQMRYRAADTAVAAKRKANAAAVMA